MINEKKHLWVLGAVWVLLYLLGNNFLTVTDPVECHYTETAREMLVYDDYFSPRIFGNFWFDKPILFYWELAAVFKLFGTTDFATRLAPTLMMGVAMGLLYWWARRLYNSSVAFVAALIMATSLESWYVGHAVVTDMTLLVTVSFTLIAFYCGYRAHNYNWYYAAFASAALAVLDKGPIGLCLPGLIILLFLLWQRDIKALLVKQLFFGLVIFCVVAGVWYVPMYMKHGQDFIDVFLGVHNVMRATVSEHPRDNVWYYYIGIFLAGFFPWVWVAIPAFIKKWRRGWRLKLDTDTRFLLVWAVTVFAVFECFATKYVTYTFPYMFPVVLLMARYFNKLGKKFFYGVAVMSLVYVGLLFGVAVPQMAKHSSRNLAVAAAPYLEQGTEVYCYRRSGDVVSFTYYTGHFVYDLVPQEAIGKKDELDWSVTDIIPKVSLESVAAESNKPLLVLVGGDAVDSLPKALPGKWKLIEKGRRNHLYYREAD